MIFTIFKVFTGALSGKFGIKLSLKISPVTTPQVCRCTTLWNISFQHLHYWQTQQWQIMWTYTEENMAVVDKKTGYKFII